MVLFFLGVGLLAVTAAVALLFRLKPPVYESQSPGSSVAPLPADLPPRAESAPSAGDPAPEGRPVPVTVSMDEAVPATARMDAPPDSKCPVGATVPMEEDARN